MVALLKERLRESTLTENYLVLPGQVLQPEAKGGVTPTENYLVLPGQVLQPEAKGGITPTENLES